MGNIITFDIRNIIPAIFFHRNKRNKFQKSWTLFGHYLDTNQVKSGGIEKNRKTQKARKNE